MSPSTIIGYTPLSGIVLAITREIALTAPNQEARVPHMLLALTKFRNSATSLLESGGVDIERWSVDLQSFWVHQEPTSLNVSFHGGIDAALRDADLIAKRLGSPGIACAHILIGALPYAPHSVSLSCRTMGISESLTYRKDANRLFAGYSRADSRPLPPRSFSIRV